MRPGSKHPAKLGAVMNRGAGELSGLRRPTRSPRRGSSGMSMSSRLRGGAAGRGPGTGAWFSTSGWLAGWPAVPPIQPREAASTVLVCGGRWLVLLLAVTAT